MKWVKYITLIIVGLVVGTQAPSQVQANTTLPSHTPANNDSSSLVTLNFEDAPLASVLEYFTKQKQINIIPHPELQNIKVSLTTRNPLTLEKAWEALYTLLESYGFTLLEVNNIYRVIPARDNSRHPLPCYSSNQGVLPDHLPDTDETIRYIYFCKNIKAGVAKSILERMLKPQSIFINEALEACVITEKSNAIKACMQIIQEFDSGGIREAIKIYRLTHTRAEVVTQLFNEHIMGQQRNPNTIRVINMQDNREGSYFSSSTKLIPEPLTNSLIIMGKNDNIDRIIDFVDKYLDVPIGTAQSRLHIKELQYLPALQVKRLLERIIMPPRTAGHRGLTEGEYKFFEDVIIAAEEPLQGQQSQYGGGRGMGNRLIIACNMEDWTRLSQFIDRLDKPQPQIAIECMIVDLSSEQERALGAQLRTPSPGIIGKDVSFHSMQLADVTTVQQEGLDTNLIEVPYQNKHIAQSILTLGDPTDTEGKGVWGVIRSICNVENSNIINQPFGVVHNNMTYHEEIAMTRLVDGAISSTGQQGGMAIRERETEKASMITRITPSITAGDVIALDLYITVSDFLQGSTSGADKSIRGVKTRALVGAGEVLVIGGLNDTQNKNQSWKVPLLGDLPLIGNLFRSKSSTDSKKSVYIFIRPSIIKPQLSAGPDDYTNLKLEYAKYQVIKNDDASSFNDPIQRWFFSSNQTNKYRLSDIAAGRVPIIDDFSEGKYAPRHVEIGKDPYFKSEEVREGAEPQQTTTLYQAVQLPYVPTTQALSKPHLTPLDTHSSLLDAELALLQEEAMRTHLPKRKMRIHSASHRS